MKTRRPSKKISAMVRYVMHRIPNVSHHRCGEDERQVCTDVYARIEAVRNHANVQNVFMIEMLYR